MQDDQPAGAASGRAVDRRHEIGAELLLDAERDRRPPVADQGVEQLTPPARGGQPFDEAGIGDQEAQPGALALDEGDCALGGRVAEVVRALQQAGRWSSP